MSAYQVDTDIIDLIVSACFNSEYGAERGAQRVYYSGDAVIYTPSMRGLVSSYDQDSSMSCVDLSDMATREDMLGRELIAANCASLAARYSDTFADKIGGMIGYLPDSYKFRHVARSRFADLGHVFGALACFEYQSCETCTRTLADVIAERIRRNVARQVSDETAPDGGAWSWSRDYVREQETRLRGEIIGGLR